MTVLHEMEAIQFSAGPSFEKSFLKVDLDNLIYTFYFIFFLLDQSQCKLFKEKKKHNNDKHIFCNKHFISKLDLRTISF